MTVPGEQVLYESTPTMLKADPVKLFFVLLFCLVLVGIPYLIAWHFQLKAKKLTITNYRIIYRKGVFSKDITEMMVVDVRNVHIEQTAFQRMWRSGTVEISSSANTGIEITTTGLDNPNTVRDLINRLRIERQNPFPARPNTTQQTSPASAHLAPNSSQILPTGPGTYEVFGVDKASKMDVKYTINADSLDAARIKAQLDDEIIVTNVSKYVAPTPPPAPKPTTAEKLNAAATTAADLFKKSKAAATNTINRFREPPAS